MTSGDFTALLPYLVLGGAIVLLTLAIAFVRHHGTLTALTALSLLAALIAVGPSLPALPRQVTPLFVLDSFGAFVCALVLLAGFFCVVLSHRYLEGRRGDPAEYYLLMAIATFGGMVTAAAAHFASFLLGLEIISISLYALIAYPEEGHAPLEAGLKYLVLSGVASTTILFGMALLYTATGSLQFAAVQRILTDQPNYDVYVVAGNVMIVAGLAFKLSLVPFHMWTPDVYQGAPAPVAGFLATVSKGALVVLAYRYLIGSGALAEGALFTAVSLIAILSMIVGNLLALLQQDLKRLLAYSSIAHLGYLMIAVLAINALAGRAFALESGLVYLVAYVAMTLTAFGVIALLSPAATRDVSAIEDYAGLFWRRPWVAALLTVALLSLAGIPTTVGFVAKFYLFSAGVDGSLWVLLWAMIIGSAIGIYYYLRTIYTMTLPPGESTSESPPLSKVGFALACAYGGSIIVIGVYPAPLIAVVGACVAGIST